MAIEHLDLGKRLALGNVDRPLAFQCVLGSGAGPGLLAIAWLVGQAHRLHPHIDDFDGRIFLSQRVAIQAVVLSMKSIGDGQHIVRLNQFLRHQHRNFVVLLEVAAVQPHGVAALRCGDLFVLELARAIEQHIVDDDPKATPVHCLQPRDEGAHKVVFEFTQQHAKGA